MKGKRLALIRQIIKTRPVETQEDLVEILKEHGLSVTQATVSRDIKELGLLKVALEDGRYRYALPGNGTHITPPMEKVKRVLTDSFVSIDSAGHLVVIKTLPGNAHAVAAMLDAIGWSEVMGTVAGDDTILIILRTTDDVVPYCERIYSLME
ncbi:MAG: transcriptional regulator AhrC/ArgR [Bacillota bacterium]